MVEKFGSGKVPLSQVLAPAIELAEDGFPVSEISSYYVSSAAPLIRDICTKTPTPNYGFPGR